MNSNPRQAPSRTSNLKPTPVALAKASSTNVADPKNTTPSHEMIAKRAYEIWLSRGREQGCDQKHWLEAELQLKRA